MARAKNPVLKTAAPFSHHGGEGAEAGAGAMLVACRLAGLSALETHYADVNRRAQCSATCGRSLNASSRWRQKLEDWHAIAGVATTVPLRIKPSPPNTGLIRESPTIHFAGKPL